MEGKLVCGGKNFYEPLKWVFSDWRVEAVVHRVEGQIRGF